MYYYLIMLQLVLALLAIFLALQAWRYFRAMRLYKQTLRKPVPLEYRRVLGRIPQYAALPCDLRRRLERKILFFLATKSFVGVGMECDDEVRVTVAFFACLMVLELPGECYDDLTTVVVYPHEIADVLVSEQGGVRRREEVTLEGQSVSGTVRIAWNRARREAYHMNRHNVIVHELAHTLDFEEGEADGIPPLEPSRYEHWSRVLYRHYRRLKRRSRRNRGWGRYRLIDRYAAYDPAEFFAVTSELFFGRPRLLSTHFPDLYEEYRNFYGLDTAELFDENAPRKPVQCKEDLTILKKEINGANKESS